jgi:2-polyprenyl-6-methoxyphenol hydroxylase-like FAD-dependent oxidoreductase
LESRFNFKPEWETSLTHLEQHEDHVTVHLKRTNSDDSATGEILEVEHLIGTDGGKSAVRKQAGLPFDGETLPDTMIFGDVYVEGLDLDHWHIWGNASSLL